MKLHELDWADGKVYRTPENNIEWKVRQKELVSTDGRNEYIDGGRYAIGVLAHLDFTEVVADDVSTAEV